MPTQNYKIRGTKVTSPYPVQLTPAETRLIFSLQKYFAPEHIYPDCYFPKTTTPSSSSYKTKSGPNPNSLHQLDAKNFRHLTTNDYLTQIDCLAVNQQGIFVFESKDYNGWIYGDSDQKYWTAVLDFGRTKNQFYNPIMQNSTHLTSLYNLFPHCQIYSFIVFGRNTTLKTAITPPKDCYICNPDTLRSRLTALPQGLLTSSEITKIHQIIQASRIAPSQITRNNHIAEVQHTKRLPDFSGSHFSRNY